MSRNAKIAIVALAVLVIGIALFTSLAQGSGSPHDAALKQTGDRLQAALRQPDGRYSNDSFLNSFNLYQAQTRQALQGAVHNIAAPRQFAQVTVWETKTMPPVWQNATQNGKPLIQVDGGLIEDVDKGKTAFTTVQQGGSTFRAYLAPLTIPPSLRKSQTHGVIAVFTPA